MKKFLLVCGVLFCGLVGLKALTTWSPDTANQGKDKARGVASAAISALP